MTKIIGLTGGIGSGKTTIAQYFQSLGIPVFIADDEAKKLLELAEIQNQIKKNIGENVFENNSISKEKLALSVFNNPGKLNKLNKIIHPAVQKRFQDWVSLQNQPFVIKEAAILFESGSYKDCDKIITVVAPLEDRINRVIRRDHSTYEKVHSRIKNQWTDEMRISKSDFIITNSNLESAKEQADEIVKKLMIQ
jgi:dephospho-CoA kinase